MIKKTRDTTALVKDLELQIDFLIGYAPQGLHWKQEYHLRKELIDETLTNENTPMEIVTKIQRIQNKLYELQNGEKNEQGYVLYSQDDYKIKRRIPVNQFGRTVDYIEL